MFWGGVRFLSFVLSTESTKLFGNHEERDISLFKIRSLLLITAKLNKTGQTHPKKSSIYSFPFPLWIADNVILPFWINGGTLIRAKLQHQKNFLGVSNLDSIAAFQDYNFYFKSVHLNDQLLAKADKTAYQND